MALPAQAANKEGARTHLWVTVEKDGRVVGRIASPNGQVRWGPSLGIELAYPVPGVSQYEELFTAGRTGPRLILHEGMTGEIAAGWSSRLAVEDLDAWGIARGNKRRRWMALSPQMEGRLAYRGFEISFGFGPAPEPEAVEAGRPRRMPLRFRRAPLAREEWPFTLLTWALYALLFYASVHLAARPLPQEVRPEAVAQRFAKLIYEAPQAPSRARAEILKQQEEARKEAEPEPEAPKPEEPKPPEPKPDTAKAEPEAPQAPPPAPEAAPAPKAPEPAPAPSPEPPGRRREQIREAVAKKGLLGLLGGRGSAATARARGGVLEGRGAAQDLDRVLEKVEGLRTAPVGSGDEKGLGAGTGLATGLGDEAVAAAGAAGRSVELQQRADAAVESTEEVSLDEFTLKEAVAAIHRVVGTYLGGIRYLYNRELRKKPDLEGKLTVSITIDPEGVVTDCHVVETTLHHPPLEEAVLARIWKWKFPAVASKPVTVTYPFVFFPSM